MAMTIVDFRPMFPFHVTELRKSGWWKEREAKVSKSRYISADRNWFELILRMMHLEILLPNPAHRQSLRDVPCSPRP